VTAGWGRTARAQVTCLWTTAGADWPKALVSPALAMGEGCNHDQQDAKVSCAEGTTWDAATGSCVTASS